jgi:hypothetical protein
MVDHQALGLLVFSNPTPDTYARAECPSCRSIKILDEDQYFGRVSTLCGDIVDEGEVLATGCGWHKTIDWSKAEV